MHDTRCGDELACRVVPEVQAGRSERYRKVDGPCMDPAQNAGDFPVFEIHLDAAVMDLEFRGSECLASIAVSHRRTPKLEFLTLPVPFPAWSRSS